MIPYQTDPGYSLCWDNVQMETKAKEQCRQRQNRMNLWANSFACLNRVNVMHLNDRRVVRASLLPLSAFLPMPDVLENIRNRMRIMVERILTTHLDAFKPLQDKITWHIPHEYTAEMRHNSKLVTENNI